MGAAPLDPAALDLVPFRDGTRLRLRVKPGARRAGLIGVHDGALKLAVSAAPEQGKANRAVVELLAKMLAVPASALEILSGQASPSKTIWVPLSPAELRRRLGHVSVAGASNRVDT